MVSLKNALSGKGLGHSHQCDIGGISAGALGGAGDALVDGSKVGGDGHA